ncbi:MAG: TlpA family protein disulfide reductase [uncultured Thiotrichaceae bacterium]|uniref:TlpA family protein disulfide reductase n=1 Tax=uncultured Thiotrichaceae bacterium TaxID=298394 RepID=A0A6S6TIM7_9GAMM|nr:MAG: TlpA family protein disulfide reductase [uncultured Thiotrichaceae bacterium]
MFKTSIIAFFLVFTTMLSNAIAEDDAKAIDLTPYKGKVVLVDFWASWCPPCRESFPWLNKTHSAKSGSDLVILGVNVDENKEDAEQFLKENKAHFKIIFDTKGQHATYYKLPGMPTTLIFDRDGKLVHQHAGFKTSEINEYEATIDKILAQ